MDRQEVLILQHVANENAGTILDFLKREKIPYRQVRMFEPGYELPPHASVRALVVMGGPMNVYEEKEYPFLAVEDRYIREALRRGIPYFGVCLGSQLLAKALDAKVYKAPVEEIGWDFVDLLAGSARDRLFGPLNLPRLQVLQWHGDTFDLPKGAVHLASSTGVPNQAYVVEGLFYGLQFHVEVNRAMIEDWFRKRGDLAAILADFDAYEPELKKLTDKMYGAFFGLS